MKILMCLILWIPNWVFAQSSKDQSRVESLFIWKASDSLGLSIKDEQKFTELLSSLGQQKRESLGKMDEAISQLQKKGVDQSKVLASYEKALKSYNQVQVSEFDQLKTLLGEEKLGKYLTLKHQLTDQLKLMLSTKKIDRQAKANE